MKFTSRMRLFWAQMWVRKDEFHRSLDIDMEAMMQMDREQQRQYLERINKRREIAHKRDLDRFY